jgi:hypothetical protein
MMWAIMSRGDPVLSTPNIGGTPKSLRSQYHRIERRWSLFCMLPTQT